ncbi:MAG: hypothetical protein ACRESI_06470 [Gammaproteobacteria bacterium]
MAGLSASFYQLGFQVSPILLTKGIATYIPGGILPIIAITEAANFVDGIISGNISINLDDFFAQYIPTPGTTLQNNEVATYPFANSTVAANSLISQPLQITMTMICPVRQNLGYYFKLAIMSALQKTLAIHNAQGGTYSIITPSYVYTDCIMTSMVDSSSPATKQAQNQWTLQFMQPLISLSQAQQVLGNLLNTISNGGNPGTPLGWSGLGNVTVSPFTITGQSVVGAVQSVVGGL